MNKNITSGFFDEYDIKVTHQICKILRFMVLILPVIVIATVTGLFDVDISYLYVVAPIWLMVTLFPSV